MAANNSKTSCYRSSEELKRSVHELAKQNGSSTSAMVGSWVELIVNSQDLRPFFVRLAAIIIAANSPELDVAAAEALVLENLEGV